MSTVILYDQSLDPQPTETCLKDGARPGRGQALFPQHLFRDTSDLMFVGNTRLYGWMSDGLVAAAAAVAGYPLTGMLWQGEFWRTLVGIFGMPSGDWLVLTVVLFIPTAALGLLAGRLARWRWPRPKLGTCVAGGTALALSVATTSAFLWWLSLVL